MAYLGKYARISTAREIVWEILRREEGWATNPFTMREFFERHRRELEASLAPLNPGASIEGTVRGALQSLNKKGLVAIIRADGAVKYSRNMYQVESALIRYTYGRAMIEAQKLHLL
jgi:predicted transcriptional regulator